MAKAVSDKQDTSVRSLTWPMPPEAPRTHALTILSLILNGPGMVSESSWQSGAAMTYRFGMKLNRSF